MIESRRDLTAWVMHFIHDRNPLTNATHELNFGEDTPLFPFTTDSEKNSRFDFWNMVEDSHYLASDEPAFHVLMKIIEDGHIRSGWSFRGNNFKPTIYGPRSACCFTEMPLYALLEYAKVRNPSDVGAYAICLLRDEIFAAGGRPAIYGLSGSHTEVPRGKSYLDIFDHWPRILEPSCGIAEDEQYRYVSMNLGGERRIDWGHEREWRWADVLDRCSCPGLPVWLADEPCQFSRVAIIVPSDEEAQTILNKLKELYDAGDHNFGYNYNKQTLAATKVISLQRVLQNSSGENVLHLRLEDIPSNMILNFAALTVSSDYKDAVRKALAEAHQAAGRAADEYVANVNANISGFSFDGFGFAHLILKTSQSEFATALIELGETSVIGGMGYLISHFTDGGTGQLSVATYAVEAARDTLARLYPKEIFEIERRWD